MNENYHIRYLKRREIDTARWDACVLQSPNGLLYGRSFFLDTMARQWDGLVLDDYKAVMPLPWNRKFGFTYLYQPYFAAMLGVFGDNPPVPGFLAAIPERFAFWEIDLNETNSRSGSQTPPPVPALTMRTNYLLALDHSYEDISNRYKRLAGRMLQKASASGLTIERNAPPSEIIAHYRQNYEPDRSKIPTDSYRRLRACAEMAFANGHAATYLARRPNGEIAAFYLILSDDRFVYSVLGGSTGQGKKEGAFYLLTDTAIKDHCSTPRTFRFEGSDVPGIAFFDAQFGSHPVPYPHLKLNRLPFPFYLLKK